MPNPRGEPRQGWREDERVRRASRSGPDERESFDNEGQAPAEPRSSVPGPTGPRIVPPASNNLEVSSEANQPTLGADYTRPPFGNSGDKLVEYGEPNPERNYPRAYDDDELQNTDLNPLMEVTNKPGTTLSVLVLFAGALIMLILIALLFYQFAVPSPRSP